ncbi:Transposase zinc-binding domain-containing protein, partial [Rhizobium sp. RU36D]
QNGNMHGYAPSLQEKDIILDVLGRAGHPITNMRASIEVADIFRAAGAAYRRAHAGHLSLPQLKVMSAVENCRTAALGGHVEACEDCGQWRIAYNSCRNRHCPKCQGAAARAWLAEREADLLPVGYFHVVFTLPAEVAERSPSMSSSAASCSMSCRAASIVSGTTAFLQALPERPALRLRANSCTSPYRQMIPFLANTMTSARHAPAVADA